MYSIYIDSYSIFVIIVIIIRVILGTLVSMESRDILERKVNQELLVLLEIPVMMEVM